ncbi:MAG TPA: LPS assembly protein LptD, partial [Aquabacterium sp.]|nr:LPS assembly protein LptD [Aquabacterium sp.]
PTYRFARTGAGGQAERVEFLGPTKLRATGATYTSCTPENTAEPDWVLSTRSVSMDFEANEGRAENAVVRFLGVPILAAPVLTFPLSEERKSGFLPPNFDIDNKSGFEFALPYYWNIAPNRDATLTPTFSSRRGLGMEAETRYLYSGDRGALRAVGLPHDQVADRQRGLLDFQHQGDLNRAGSPTLTTYDLRWRRVSDDDYWKDFPRNLPTLTPRLYDSHAGIERQINTRAWGLGASQTTMYARVQSWQTLQDLDPQADASARIISPYRREPQVGVRSRSLSESGWLWRFEGEFNRFTNEDRERVSGNRLHALAQIERPMGSTGWNLTPKLSVNAASYDLDNPLSTGSNQVSRVIP